MSRVLPILFNTDMVRAILDGRKTVTRRVVKFLPGKKPNWTGYIKDGLVLYNGTNEPCNKLCQYQPGDYIYVRETWNTYCEGCLSKELESVLGSTCTHSCGENGNGYYYRATDKNHNNWRPSIHMPKEAARIWLKVTDVRVERLKDITEEQAEAEGFRFTPPCLSRVSEDSYCDLDGPCTSKIKYCDMSAGELFGKVLWDSTIKKSDLDRYGWDANPWVWVIEFERCEKPESEG